MTPALLLPILATATSAQQVTLPAGTEEMRVERAVARYVRPADSSHALGFENLSQLPASDRSNRPAHYVWDSATVWLYVHRSGPGALDRKLLLKRGTFRWFIVRVLEVRAQ